MSDKNINNKKKRSAFTFQEDCLLSNLVMMFGNQKWDIISSCMIERTPRQCRERWKSYLSPGLSNGPWSEQEDNLLLDLYYQYGTKWVTISKYFQGRSDSNVKNRWYTHLIHRVSKDNNVNNINNKIEINNKDSSSSSTLDYDVNDSILNSYDDEITPYDTWNTVI